LGVGGGLEGGAYGGDFLAFDEDLAVGQNGAGIVEGDNESVFNERCGHGDISCGFEFSTLWKNIFHSVEKVVARFPCRGKTFSGDG